MYERRWCARAVRHGLGVRDLARYSAGQPPQQVHVVRALVDQQAGAQRSRRCPPAPSGSATSSAPPLSTSTTPSSVSRPEPPYSTTSLRLSGRLPPYTRCV